MEVAFRAMVSLQEELLPDGTPRPLPGERFEESWENVKFFFGSTTTGSGGGWAQLASFYGFGNAHVSACRLVLVMNPNIRGLPSCVSIPMAWLCKEKLVIRRPFFDCRHIFGTVIPTDMTRAGLSAYTLGPIGKPLEFRIELLEPGKDEHMLRVLKSILSDPDGVQRHTKVLQSAADAALVPTNVHYAFVDPNNPRYLYLATQMSYKAS